MTSKSGKEVFIRMMSSIWHGNQHAGKIYDELSQVAQDPEIQGALEARGFVTKKIQDTLDECFRILGEKPMPANTRMQEVFLEDFKREIVEIQGPIARRLFVLSKINAFIHMRIGQLVALVAAADLTGNYAVGLLMETVLADKLAFAERTRRMLRRVAEERISEKVAA